jgi:chitinase
MAFALVALLAGVLAVPSFAFDMSRSDNIAIYWGQNSYGATHPNDPVCIHSV